MLKPCYKLREQNLKCNTWINKMFLTIIQTFTFVCHVSAFTMSKLATHVSSHVPVVPSWGGVHMNFPSQELLFPIILTPLECALIQRITCIEQFLNVSWTSEKRKKLWFYLTFLHFLLLVSGPHESETPIHKQCSKVYVQDVFQWKGNKRSDYNPYRTT